MSVERIAVIYISDPRLIHIDTPYPGANAAEDIVGNGAREPRDLLGVQLGFAFLKQAPVDGDIANFYTLVIGDTGR